MSDTPPEQGQAPTETSASGEPERQELPRSISYVVIGVTVLAIAGYAVWTAMHPEPVDEAMVTPDGAKFDAGIEFTLEPVLVPAESIVAGGPPRDGVPALVDPEFLSGEQAKLDPRMRVIGVDIEGDARAYPLAIMNYHEVVNDTVGGRKIAVTYCPLCDLARAFDRKVGAETLEFGVSGRLLRANILLFDRRESVEQESLWSQIEARAISGPMAAKAATLEPLPVELTTWGEWAKAHPESKSLSPKTGHKFNYTQNPYAAYLTNDVVNFPLPERSKRRPKAKNKSHVTVVRSEDQARAYFFSDLKAAEGPVRDQLGDQTFTLKYTGKGVEVDAPAELDSFSAFWFAVDVLSPTVEVWDGKPTGVGAPQAGESGETGETGETGDATSVDGADEAEGDAADPAAKPD